MLTFYMIIFCIQLRLIQSNECVGFKSLISLLGARGCSFFLIASRASNYYFWISLKVSSKYMCQRQKKGLGDCSLGMEFGDLETKMPQPEIAPGPFANQGSVANHIILQPFNPQQQWKYDSESKFSILGIFLHIG